MPFLYPTDQPRVFAHRGLSIAADGSAIDENTIPAFARALEVGAHYIESDIQVTSDGVPVLFHDDDLSRVAGVPSPVGKLTLAELQEIRLEHGGQIPTLVEALREFPATRFNLDFKSVSSILAGTAAISSIGAQGRVLVASFSDARRLAALNKLPGAATSAGASMSTRWLGNSINSSNHHFDSCVRSAPFPGIPGSSTWSKAETRSLATMRINPLVPVSPSGA